MNVISAESVALAGRYDIPPDHHRVILVHHIVAVHDVLAEEVAPATEECHFGHRFQLDNVFARTQHAVTRYRFAVDRQNLEFLKVRVNRVSPLLSVILERPNFCRALLDFRVDTVGIHKPAVHGPQAIVIVELEGSPPPHFAHVDRRQFAHEVGNPAWIGYLGTFNIEPHDQVALIEHASLRSGAIFAHFQPVGQIDFLAGAIF